MNQAGDHVLFGKEKPKNLHLMLASKESFFASFFSKKEESFL